MKNHLLVAAACAALTSGGLVGAADAAAPATTGAAERPTFCNRHTYDTKVRFVQGSTAIGISRISARTYAGRTVIHRGETVTTQHRKTFAAKVGSTVGASIGASAMLKKVVNVFVEAHGDTSYRASYGTTGTETRTVTTDTTTTIPAGRTVIWFVGHRIVSGTFEYSSCNATDGHDQDTGVVKWRKTSWSSFSIRDDGGQRCDLPANTSVAKAAKRIGCDA